MSDLQNQPSKFQKFMNAIKPRLPETLKKIIQEHDHSTYSSARAWGGWIFLILGICNLILAGSIGWGIHHVLMLTPIDNPALLSLVTSIKNLAWLYVILAATALALYGINVWKYVAQIRNGIYNRIGQNIPDTDDDIQQPTAINNSNQQAPQTPTPQSSNQAKDSEDSAPVVAPSKED